MAALSVRDRRQKKERKKVRSFFFPSFFWRAPGPERRGKERNASSDEKNEKKTRRQRHRPTRYYSPPRLFPGSFLRRTSRGFSSILSFHQIMRGEAESEKD